MSLNSKNIRDYRAGRISSQEFIQKSQELSALVREKGEKKVQKELEAENKPSPKKESSKGESK